jgi:NADH-quinone oxidoreductase subunit K
MGSEVIILTGVGLTLIGLLGVLLRKNLIMIVLCLELMTLGALIGLVAAARVHPVLGGMPTIVPLIFAVLVIAAAEVCIGLALIVKIYQVRQSAWVDEIDTPFSSGESSQNESSKESLGKDHA